MPPLLMGCDIVGRKLLGHCLLQIPSRQAGECRVFTKLELTEKLLDIASLLGKSTATQRGQQQTTLDNTQSGQQQTMLDSNPSWSTAYHVGQQPRVAIVVSSRPRWTTTQCGQQQSGLDRNPTWSTTNHAGQHPTWSAADHSGQHPAWSTTDHAGQQPACSAADHCNKSLSLPSPSTWVWFNEYEDDREICRCQNFFIRWEQLLRLDVRLSRKKVDKKLPLQSVRLSISKQSSSEVKCSSKLLWIGSLIRLEILDFEIENGFRASSESVNGFQASSDF
ncbi:hypothetical protein HS088_TW01G00412 [Tripterygium wilfordii]|uniref:Uncharacterized protein n=1 Tax=Tripterygium wilfordii TaxID=458696 RepID=A0A7J7E1H7_TRIWF|nr:hypothetical protein HS088_TW01G00412 [Tripterygium wilfordii]